MKGPNSRLHPLPSQERLKELLTYYPETGTFTWNKYRGRGMKKALEAGSIGTGGYISIKISGIRYRAHRLAWMYTHGEVPLFIDHINRIPSDNRLCNLRLATLSQNSANSKIPKRNTSGAKGVSWHGQNNKWRVEIRSKNKYIYIGSYSDISLASEAYRIAANKFFGEFANKDVTKESLA